MRLVACLVFLGLGLGGCGSVLGSDDTEELPPRPESDAGAPPSDASPSPVDGGEETCTRRLPCGGSEVGANGELVPSPSRLCLEACVKLSYDPAGFGDQPGDFVKIVDVVLSAGGGDVGTFNLGLAKQPYLFVSGQSGFDVLQWQHDQIPRDRWVHFRVDVRFATSPNAEVFVDGVLVAERPIPTMSPASLATVTYGPLTSGTHPKTEITFALRRMTRY